MCAKEKFEPESGKARRGESREEKVSWGMQSVDGRWMKGEETQGRHSTDGQSNCTVHLSLTNGVRQIASVSHFKACLKAVQHYQ